ncbi:BTAD domain-containing putative transcriptional regulator [Pseudofrankia sp. BMG5.37]|uniref:BTAD domain-containing putative transcriptional regulator n=1 Tax=Pseudofrankia sp. BMG5.37 TaxID=3050035 RepID=UPI002893E477|nr:BTAD domain-containing putative transcriptional regulator [Pseudofrankia sp. BMG5.37]MDT3443389.1 BTAD domain-containing putative transcriptional regulator [Pseudofrankia sp. BMG5.37]
MDMDICLFGGLRVFRAGHAVDLGRPKQRFLLGVLVLDAGRTVPAQRLAELLWGRDGDRERASLQAYVSHLRRALEPPRAVGAGPSVVVRQPPGYRLAADRAQVDVLRFEDLLSTGRRCAGAGRDAEALDAFESAAALWTAPPLPEFADRPVVLDAATRLRGLLGVALEGAAEIHLRTGRADAAASLLEPAVAEFPLRERLHSLLALALYRTARQADALRVIDSSRRALIDAVGLAPSAELRELQRRILAQAADLDWQPAVATPPELTGGTAIEAGPPSSLRWEPLLGRDGELELLRRAAAGAVRGRGGAVTVSGPSGIGKTALVEQMTDLVATSGFATAWARCPENGGSPPFWALAHLGRQLRDVGALPVDLLAADPAGAGDPFVLAQAAVGALRGANRPVLLVIDDLQWADRDTLRVLAHLIKELRTTRTLLLVTTRPPESAAGDELGRCLAELARQQIAEVTLHELSLTTVTEWLAIRAGSPVPPTIAAHVQSRTGGLPLFIRELVELLAAEGRLADPALPAGWATVPFGVKSIVRRRVARLPTARAQRLLSIASVLGSPFDLAVVADVAESPLGEALVDLADILDAGLVVPDGAAGMFRFSHVLVAEALADEVNAARRAGLHAAAARSVARRHPGDEHAARVAQHAVAGAAAGTALLAATAARRAARLAQARAAHAEAARHWASVVEMLERSQPEDGTARLRALVELARAHQRAGEVRAAQQAVVAAVEVAGSLGDVAAMGNAVAVLNHPSIYPNQPYGVVDLRLVAVLDGVLAALPADDSAARVLVLAALATELFHSSDTERRDHATNEAIDIARRLGDPAVLAGALHARTFALKRPAAVPVRRRVALELLALAEQAALGDDLVLVAQLQVTQADFALGDFDAVQAGLPRCLGLGDRPVGQALRGQLGFFRALFELARGRYSEAVRHAEEAFEVFRRGRGDEAGFYRLAQRLTIGHDLGGLDDGLIDAVLADAEVTGFALAVRLYVAVILFDLGRPDDAVRQLPYPRGTVPDRPLDYVTVFIDVAAAIVAAETGDAVAAAVLLDRITPWAGRWASAGTAAASLGLVDLAIARLHAAVGDTARARPAFAAAVAGHERVGSPAWLARSLLHQGRFLRAAGDGAAASAAFTRAAALADAFALPIVAGQIVTAQS